MSQQTLDCHHGANLVTLTINELNPRDRDAVQSNLGIVRALERSMYPSCFQHVENVVGRSKMEEAIKQVIAQRQGQPGELCRLIADWPVAGYLTTNYDDLLEDALGDLRELGWIFRGQSAPRSAKSIRRCPKHRLACAWCGVHGRGAI